MSVSLTPRYETLAVATEAENRQDPDLPLKTGGKRLTVSPEHTSCQTDTLYAVFNFCQ